MGIGEAILQNPDHEGLVAIKRQMAGPKCPGLGMLANRAKKICLNAARSAQVEEAIRKQPPGREWGIGRIAHGNALDVLRDMRAKKFRANHVITDPPYGIGLAYDGFAEPSTWAEHWDWLRPIVEATQHVAAVGGSQFWFQSNQYIRHLEDAFVKVAGVDVSLSSVCRIRRKMSGGQAGMYRWWEVGVYWRTGGEAGQRTAAEWFGGDIQEDASGGDEGDEAMRHGHPCPKPEGLVQRIVRAFSGPGEVILDPFAGAGTIPFVAQAEGRKWAAVEQSQRYCGIMRERLGLVSDTKIA